jgi:hypothetical protein
MYYLSISLVEYEVDLYGEKRDLRRGELEYL